MAMKIPLISALCRELNCSEQQISDVLNHPRAIAKANKYLQGKLLITTYKSKTGAYQQIKNGQIGFRPASEQLAYEGYLQVTVQVHYYCVYKIRLRHPHLRCIMQQNDNNAHIKYYPAELLMVYEEDEEIAEVLKIIEQTRGFSIGYEQLSQMSFEHKMELMDQVFSNLCSEAKWAKMLPVANVLGLKSCAPLLLVDLLFNNHGGRLVQKMKKHKDLLKEISEGDKKAERALLDGFGQLILADQTNMLPNAGPIYKKLVDQGVVQYETVEKWLQSGNYGNHMPTSFNSALKKAVMVQNEWMDFPG